jgi:hypothetical protein
MFLFPDLKFLSFGNCCLISGHLLTDTWRLLLFPDLKFFLSEICCLTFGQLLTDTWGSFLFCLDKKSSDRVLALNKETIRTLKIFFLLETKTHALCRLTVRGQETPGKE